MPLAVLQIPDTPPSFNDVGYRTHWAVARGHKRRWQDQLALLLLAKRVPRPLARVDVTATIYFTERRRRDEGNFRVIVEKALGDALQEGGWLPDDTPDFYRFGKVRLLQPCTERQTYIEIDYQEVT
jgi:hypothetical protein